MPEESARRSRIGGSFSLEYLNLARLYGAIERLCESRFPLSKIGRIADVVKFRGNGGKN